MDDRLAKLRRAFQRDPNDEVLQKRIRQHFERLGLKTEDYFWAPAIWKGSGKVHLEIPESWQYVHSEVSHHLYETDPKLFRFQSRCCALKSWEHSESDIQREHVPASSITCSKCRYTQDFTFIEGIVSWLREPVRLYYRKIMSHRTRPLKTGDLFNTESGYDVYERLITPRVLDAAIEILTTSEALK